MSLVITKNLLCGSLSRHGWSFEKAGSYVRKRRTKVFPNLGFIKQMLQLENDMKKHYDSCVSM
jgi:hypothetical protein